MLPTRKSIVEDQKETLLLPRNLTTLLCLLVSFINRDKTFATTEDLIDHLNSEHEHKIAKESQTFQCWDDFMKWQTQEERMTKSWFVKQRADRRTKSYKTSWFYCNRNGTFSSRGKGKRALRSQGSSKTCCSCPAFITARTDAVTGEVTAEYCLQHVGHRQEIAFTRISTDMRSRIAAKLAQGVSMTSILDYIRDTQAGPLTRDHLTTRADLRNIKHQYNIDCIQKDSDDATSVSRWVEEMMQENYNPILCYKPQGEESDEQGVEKNDFLLAFQTEFQREMFTKYASKLICVDATHGTTAYDFQLMTVLVIDDYDEGIPVAWLISNKESADVLRVFFKSLRDTCGDVQTEYFMSDDADAYHNAWSSIFTKPVRKLLCSWHVDRSWRRKLNELIKDKDQQVEVYAALKSLQNEPSECKFRRSLQQFLAWLKGISKPMASYFEKEYASRPREWATCFREGTPANTNMFVESFHRTLKEIYLERKQNRRVDHLLSTLRKISRDKAYEQWIKAEKGKATQRQRDNNKRHKQAESIPAKSIIREDAGSWQVQSATEKNKVYLVKRVGSSVCTCLLRCPLCAACTHSYKCTCLDYAVRNLVCCHIHAVNLAKPPEEAMTIPDEADDDVAEKRECLESLIQQDKDPQNENDLEDLKRSAMAELAELSDILQSAPSKDTVHAALRHIRAAKSVSRGLSVIGNDHQYVQTRSFPPNKLAEKQKRFFSTKKSPRCIGRKSPCQKLQSRKWKMSTHMFVPFV